LLAGLDVIDYVGRQVGGDTKVHSYLEQHGSGSVAGVGNAHGARGAVAAEELHAVLVQGGAQAGAVGHGEVEVAVVQRRFEDLLGQQQRPEQLRAPLQVGEG